VFPRKHATGTETYWVIRAVTGPIDHDPLNPKGKVCKADEMDEAVGYRRVEDQIAVQVIEVGAEQVKAWLDESAETVTRVKREREEEAQRQADEAAGIMKLTDPDGKVTEEATVNPEPTPERPEPEW
jgi:hypothetical protein